MHMLGCPSSSETETWHRAQPISPFSRGIDLDFLKYLTSKPNLGDLERIGGWGDHNCYFVTHRQSRGGYCGKLVSYIHILYLWRL
jgi:hypothetical protein